MRYALCDSCRGAPSSQVGFDDLRISLNFQRGSFCDLLPIIQNRDGFRDSHHDPHLVLDEDDRDPQFIAEVPNKVHDVLSFTGVHACRRFIKEQKFWPGSQRASDFESPLIPVGKIFRQKITFALYAQEDDLDKVTSTVDHLFTLLMKAHFPSPDRWERP